MRLSILASILSLTVSGVLASDDSTASAPSVEVEYINKVEDCERRTENGDPIQVHYRGSLAADGSEFDNSYDRGTPLKFKLGAGRVIKGLVSLFSSFSLFYCSLLLCTSSDGMVSFEEIANCETK